MNDRDEGGQSRRDEPADDGDWGNTSHIRLRAPGPNEVLAAVLELSRVVTVDLHTDEVVHAYIERFKRLFPARLFCVRLLSPQAGELSMVYATGRLKPERRDRIELSREAIQRHGIPLPQASMAVVESESYRPFFLHGAHGFDVPMMDGERLSGVLSVEYPETAAAPEDDRALIVQLALQLGSALRNSRLHRLRNPFQPDIFDTCE